MFVGNQKSNQFVIFRIDPKTGQLSPTGQVFDVPTPVAFQFVPAE
jgi:6-phosphogluconolactonase (cycloisomerase 2 family)